MIILPLYLQIVKSLRFITSKIVHWHVCAGKAYIFARTLMRVVVCYLGNSGCKLHGAPSPQELLTVTVPQSALGAERRF